MLTWGHTPSLPQLQAGQETEMFKVVRGRMREREGVSVLSRHVLLQIDFSVPVLGIFQLVVVWGRERTQLSPG